uniref:Uncharacterized protein n=1 Tax=Arundo donax TaxID=35708 RepID=A0A0A9FCQ1_ARUDO
MQYISTDALTPYVLTDKNYICTHGEKFSSRLLVITTFSLLRCISMIA